MNLKPLSADDVDADLVGTKSWRRAVFAHPDLPPGAADRDAYVMCVLTRLHA
ncbi:hypothetical protein AB0I28_03640 [Phytomonospora sp. NPDC050363]|uniref:hypothetical protein n=1 Tax=Phytomonospora sp. NPDC050363 TaxID=3155642 RepID=UPI0033FC4619